VPQDEKRTPTRALLYVASVIAVLVGGVQFLIGPWLDDLYAENWHRVPIWLLDIADMARLLLGPTAVALAYRLSRRAVHADRTELGLTRPRERMQAILGVLCVVVGFGMFSSFWITQTDPSVEPLGLPRTVERTTGTPSDLALTEANDTAPNAGEAQQTDSGGTSESKPVRAHPLLELLDQGRSKLTMIALIVVVCVFAPVAEELLFRAMLFSWLRRRIGAFPAGVVSTWLFTIIHVPIVRPTMLAPLAALAAGLCLLSWRNESIVPAIAVHVVVNSLAIAQGQGALVQAVAVIVSLGATAMILRSLRCRYDAQVVAPSLA
jgi:membrane protease YdiL (CAAX protease family)